MISLVVFSAVVLSLGVLSAQMGKRSTKATDQALHMARQIAAADKAVTVPYDSLSSLLKADTVMSGTVRVVTAYSDTVISASRTDVRIITSTSVPGSRTDTIVITRGRFRYPVPLR